LEQVADVWAALCPGLVHDDQAMDAPSTLRLIAPRPLLVVNGESDPRCPAQGVREALATALPEWADAGQGDQVQLYFERNGGHAVTAGMWAKVDAFFARQLSPTAKGKR
jgi:predicted esterase